MDVKKEEEALDVPSHMFDPIAFVNARFPDEASLAEVEAFASRLESQIGTLDEELALAVRAQSQQAGKALDDLDKAKNAVGELHAKVKGIRGKAEDSEKRVKAVCHDITRLDRAKTNLQATMTALMKAAQLLTTVEQLEFLTEARQYSDAAKVLQNVNELNDFFNSHDSVPKIKEVRATVARVKDALTKSVFEDVQQGLGAISDDTFTDDPGYYPVDSQTPDALRGACAVADLLSATTRKQLRKTLITNYLRPYEVIFKPDIDEKDAERRYLWFNRLLDNNERMFAELFPPHWKMEKLIALRFCQMTSEQYQRVLDSGSVNVPVMVKTLKKTVEFELSLNHRFGISGRGRGNSLGESSQDRSRGNSLEAIDGGATPPPMSPAYVDEAVSELPTNWRGIISSIFQPFMGAFVRLLSDNVRDQVERAMVEELVEQANATDSKMMREYPSSFQLFQAIKQTMNSMLEYSTAQPFLDLCLAYKVRLTAYADALERRGGGSQFTTSSSQSGYGMGASGVLPPSFLDKPFDTNAARALCFAINTAGYMTEEIPNFQKTVVKKLDPSLADKVDYSPERERFMDVASKTVTTLAARLVGKLEPILDQIARQNWLALKEVGDQSNFVTQIRTTLEEFVPVINLAIATTIYFRSFCDSFASAFMRAFQVMVLNLKRVSEVAAQQLHVDCEAIEKILNDVPIMGSKQNVVDNFKIYRRFIENGMRRHKMLFKILGMQVSYNIAVEDFIRLMGPSASMVLFNQMLDMRGITKPAERTSAIRMAEEAGVPATCGEDEMVEQIKQQMAKDAAAAGAAAAPQTALSGVGNIFSSLSAKPSSSALGSQLGTAASTPAVKSSFSALLKRPMSNPSPAPGAKPPPPPPPGQKQ